MSNKKQILGNQTSLFLNVVSSYAYSAYASFVDESYEGRFVNLFVKSVQHESY